MLIHGRRAGRGAIRLALAILACALSMVLAAGCAGPLRFPAEPVEVASASAGQQLTYDTDGDGQADYVAVTNKAGRITRIGYAPTGGEPDALVDLDAVPAEQCRHVVIILDGVGYRTVRAYREAGHLRLFYPPARVISTFPSMTDVALADVFQSVRPIGYEARYFDHRTNRLAGGDGDYLAMVNEDWARCTDYRAGTLVDPLSYLFPRHYFKEELKTLLDLIERRDRPMVVAYLVSTAGLGTKHLREGQIEILRALDRLTHQVIWQSRGLVKVTVFSDHGHQLVPAKWIDFRAFLRERGWRVTEHLDEPKDVAVIDYGLVTYASFAARDRAGLAAALLECEGVDVVTYQDDGVVVVRSDEGKAHDERQHDRFRYVQETGDPLHLAAIVKQATSEGAIDADGFADEGTWLRLTYRHTYPDPVVRLWRAFHGITEHVPDVIASLCDGYSAGLPSRAARYPDGASTHGDLAAKSSTAFLMSTSGPVPEGAQPLRSRDLPKVLPALLGRPWPPPRKEKP
ncbi:MAG: hypothetical protein U9R68_03900 [Planctomycetota bacterium]|nr:hypothetical protein [Planctomycetota bacterium]